MKNVNTRIKLFAFLVILIVLPSALVGYSSYLNLQKKLHKNLIERATENVSLINNNITDTFSNQFVLLDFLSKSIEIENLEEQSMPNVINSLKNVIETHEEIESAYIGTESGETIVYPSTEPKSDADPRTSDWYSKAKENNGEYIITNLYEDTTTKSISVKVAKALPDNSGVIAFDVKLDDLKKTLLNVKNGKNGIPPYILDKKQKVVFHQPSKLSKDIKTSILSKIYNDDKGLFKSSSNDLVYETNKLTGWKIINTIDKKEVFGESKSILVITGAIVLLFLFIGSLIFFQIIRLIMKPIRELIHLTEEVSNGNLSVTASIDSKDEMGKLGLAFNKMVQSLVQLISKLNKTSSKLVTTADSFTMTFSEANQISNNIKNSMIEMASGAEVQMTTTNESSIATEEVASGVQYVAEKLAEVNDSSFQATNNVEQGYEYLVQGITEMQNISQTVQENYNLVQHLGNKSKEINSIINVIKGISEQTNLLALNASIEAARAGEYGKGFSVVAQEIRKLAEASKTSTVQISEILSAIQEETTKLMNAMDIEKQQTANGFEAIALTGDKFNEIKRSINEVNRQIQEISATSEEISASTEEISASFNEISSIATSSYNSTKSTIEDTEEQMRMMTQQSSMEVRELTSLVLDLQDEISIFKLNIDTPTENK
ncbi:methyl-accepting chemotaxis protein [Gottfriedia solisilvae]|uniref:Methyl-accepting chemotaxis protein n=1 Tax=Gottfriedia solisilvae TaxID=1516104 RepID=A0A8J3ASI9_9BACI|nr:methyl-accepting chemotaxis protein [Gottfriedia solisilvae]GGI17895.1 methyl-accepting chemotaxis protein [Gottfriedia solisilvae]